MITETLLFIHTSSFCDNVKDKTIHKGWPAINRTSINVTIICMELETKLWVFRCTNSATIIQTDRKIHHKKYRRIRMNSCIHEEPSPTYFTNVIHRWDFPPSSSIKSLDLLVFQGSFSPYSCCPSSTCSLKWALTMRTLKW